MKEILDFDVLYLKRVLRVRCNCCEANAMLPRTQHLSYFMCQITKI